MHSVLAHADWHTTLAYPQKDENSAGNTQRDLHTSPHTHKDTCVRFISASNAWLHLLPRQPSEMQSSGYSAAKHEGSCIVAGWICLMMFQVRPRCILTWSSEINAPGLHFSHHPRPARAHESGHASLWQVAQHPQRRHSSGSTHAKCIIFGTSFLFLALTAS